jgi:hypothetical protein
MTAAYLADDRRVPGCCFLESLHATASCGGTTWSTFIMPTHRSLSPFDDTSTTARSVRGWAVLAAVAVLCALLLVIRLSPSADPFDASASAAAAQAAPAPAGA